MTQLPQCGATYNVIWKCTRTPGHKGRHRQGHITWRRFPSEMPQPAHDDDLPAFDSVLKRKRTTS